MFLSIRPKMRLKRAVLHLNQRCADRESNVGVVRLK